MNAGTVVVTGGGRGLGRAIAGRLCGEGHHVVIAERDPDTAHAAAEELIAAGGLATAVVTDIGDVQSVRALADELERLDSHLIGLVNNAAIADGVAEKSDQDDPKAAEQDNPARESMRARA